MLGKNTSILLSVKEYLGLIDAYTVFDSQIIMCINSAFSALSQLGVGPTDGFEIDDENNQWSEYTSSIKMNFVQTYVCMKVKLMWDPPTSSFALDAMKQQVSEMEWRLNIQAESEETT